MGKAMNGYFDKELIEKYKMNGPRYTSYPTAVQFDPKLTAQNYLEALEKSNHKNRDLSLYFHIPFCENVCYYCGCNRIITKNHQQSQEYLNYLKKDIDIQIKSLNPNRKVVQLHFGGGTPTFLTPDELAGIVDHLRQKFIFADDNEGEFSIEIDPRTVNDFYLKKLREMGFNRVSFGVQDIDFEVQKAVNRIQSLKEIKQMVETVRLEGFHSLSIDLIYGLPLQTPKSFAKTIDEIIKLSPDRLAVFHYAHMPHLFGAQKQINEQYLPSSDAKLQMLEQTINQLTNAGYEFIGLDHFAKPNDSLVKHQQNGTLYRNFQGYSTFSQCDLLGFGVSSISMLENYFSQHHKARSKYYQLLNQNQLPALRGIALNQDDHIRQKVINELMCNLTLDTNKISQQFNINFNDYFHKELVNLAPLTKDGLIEINQNKIKVLPIGRLLIRNIAMIFDYYLNNNSDNDQRKFSKVL